MQTLEELLKRALAEGYTYDNLVIQQLCRQIAAEKIGKSFRKLYVSRSVSDIFLMSD